MNMVHQRLQPPLMLVLLSEVREDELGVLYE